VSVTAVVTCSQLKIFYDIFEVYWGQNRNAGLIYSILADISFKLVSLGTYTAIPSFFPRFKSTVEVIFLNAVEHRLRFPLDVRHCFETSSRQFHFQFRKESEITGGYVRRVGRMGNDNHVVVSYKLCLRAADFDHLSRVGE
jgi:hypothetical protein